MKMLLDLFKLRIGVVIALTAMAGLAVSPGTGPGAAPALALFVAVLLSSAAAGAFNQLHEVDLDRKMRRTGRRPFVTGALRPGPLWIALIALLILASTTVAWLATNALAAVFTFLGAFIYAIVYTVWLKRRTWWNIVVGGLAGSFAVLAGAAAATPALSAEALVLALVLFLWTPPHFWSLAIACRDDYAAAGVPMLPMVVGERLAAQAILLHAVLLVATSVGLAALAPGPLYLACAIVGGALLLHRAIELAASPGRLQAMRCFRASLVQLSLVLLGVVLDAGARAAVGA